MRRKSLAAGLGPLNCVFNRFGDFEEIVEIPRGLLAQLFHAQPKQFAEFARCFLDERRLVSPPAMGHRCEKWGIGLDQHAVQRDLDGSVANLLCLGKRDIARERNHESHVESALGLWPDSGKAMQDSAQAAARPVLLDQVETISPRVVARFRGPSMDYDGQPRGTLQFRLLHENLLLDFARRMVVVVVESDFAPGNYFGVLGELF